MTFSFRMAMLTLCASFLLSCGFDAGSLPEVQTPDVVEPLPFDEGVEMPLHAVRLALAAEVGGLAMIDEFHQTSTELDWPDDGARAVKLAARYGQRDAVRLLLAYGVCDVPSKACAEASGEAQSRQYATIVALLQSGQPPK